MALRKMFLAATAMVGALIVTASQPASLLAQSREPLSHFGVVILHGQQGSRTDNQLVPLVRALRSAGAKVRISDMGWSKSSYMEMTYDQAIARIAKEIEPLRKDGATRIVLAGQSLGANAAIAYVAQGGQVDGLVLMSLGAFSEDSSKRADIAQSLAIARKDVADGNGAKVSSRVETQANNQTFTTQARADAYVSYKSADGPACVRCNMAKISPEFPMLFASAPNDGLDFSRVKAIVATRKADYVSMLEIAGVDHFTLPRVIAPQAIAWMTERFPAN